MRWKPRRHKSFANRRRNCSFVSGAQDDGRRQDEQRQSATASRDRRCGFRRFDSDQKPRQSAVDVTLIDAQNHHCFQPLLYQVATAALSPADVAWPIRAILRKQQNARVIMAQVTGVDVEARRVHTTEVDSAYDYLVLATARPTPISATTIGRRTHPDWNTFPTRPRSGGAS